MKKTEINELPKNVEEYLQKRLELLQQGCDQALKEHAQELSKKRTNHFWQIFRDQTETLEQNILRLTQMYNDSVEKTKGRKLPERLEREFKESSQKRFKKSIESSVRFFKKSIKQAAKTLDIDTKVIQKTLDQIKIESENIL